MKFIPVENQETNKRVDWLPITKVKLIYEFNGGYISVWDENNCIKSVINPKNGEEYKNGISELDSVCVEL